MSATLSSVGKLMSEYATQLYAPGQEVARQAQYAGSYTHSVNLGDCSLREWCSAADSTIVHVRRHSWPCMGMQRYAD